MTLKKKKKRKEFCSGHRHFFVYIYLCFSSMYRQVWIYVLLQHWRSIQVDSGQVLQVSSTVNVYDSVYKILQIISFFVRCFVVYIFLFYLLLASRTILIQKISFLLRSRIYVPCSHPATPTPPPRPLSTRIFFAWIPTTLFVQSMDVSKLKYALVYEIYFFQKRYSHHYRYAGSQANGLTDGPAGGQMERTDG